MTITYRTGTDLLIAGPRAAVLLDPAAADLLSAVWGLVQADFEPLALIDLLAGRGLGNVPDFAFYYGDASDVRLFLRGRFIAHADSAGTGRDFTASDVATWSEVRLTDLDSVTLAGHASDEESLPLVAGIVLAASVAAVWREPVAPVMDESAGSFAGLGDTQRDPAPAAAASYSEPTVEHDSFDVPRGDHDGHTISAAEIARLRAERAGRFDEVPASPAELVAVHPRAHLVLPGLEQVDIDRPVYVGRAPAARQRNGTELPRLIPVAPEDVDVSRTHVEVRFEGSDLVATDLSSNGTVIVRDGAPPRRLEPGVPTLLTDGVVLQLSDDTEVAVTVEETHDG